MRMIDLNGISFFIHRTGSNPKIRRNKIWGGQNGGILVYNSGMCNPSYFSVLINFRNMLSK